MTEPYRYLSRMPGPAYQHISPTAKLVAEMRRYSDIPHAETIAKAIGATEAVRAALAGADLSPGVLAWMAPLTEARYKSLRVAIERAGNAQVLELASGFSFRGSTMPRLRYVETDLPEIHAERVRLRAELGLCPAGDDWLFAPADATVAADLLAAPLVPGPVTVVHEGLIQYLTVDEKRAVARAIAAVLDAHGGVWVTPDFETMEDALVTEWRDPQFREIGAFIASSTKRNLAGSAFVNRAQVADFLAAEGFTVEVTPQVDGSFALASVARAGMTDEQLAKLTAKRMLWTMRRA